MRYLNLVHEERRLAECEVKLPYVQRFLNPVYSLEPGQFHFACVILYVGNKALRSFFTDDGKASQLTSNLREFGSGIYGNDLIDPGFIDVAERIKFKQVFKGKNAQLLFQQVCFLRANPF